MIRITFDEANLTEEKAIKYLTDLHTNFDTINKTSPPLSGRSYRIAEKNVATGKGEVVRDPDDDPRSNPQPDSEAIV